MPRFKQFFNRRIDQDSENRLVEQGKYRTAKNARVGTSQRNNVGAIESMPSNELISFPLSGENKCIGTCQDTKNTSIIYCFYNSSNNHRIIRYSPSTGIVTDILPITWNVAALGWTSSTRLWNIRIVETGNLDQIMFFHAVQGVPNRINLSIAAKRPGTYTLTSDDITVARKPPIKAPTLVYVLDTSSASSFIQNKFFQFRYRFIYEDKEQSTWSPWSNISIPPQDGVSYNKIVVTFNSGVKGVTKVEIARREGNGGTQTGIVNPTLYVFNTWTKGVNSDNTNYSVDFFNSEVLTPISSVSSNKLFEQVPQVVGSQELVQSNQVIYGDITEGYDNLVNTNVAINQTFDVTGILKITTVNNSGNYRIITGDTTVPAVGDTIYIQIGLNVYWGLATVSGLATDIAAIINELNGFTATVVGLNVDTNIPYLINFLIPYSVPNLFYKPNKIIDWNKRDLQVIAGTSGYQKISWGEININGVNRINATDFSFHDDATGSYINIVVKLRVDSIAPAIPFNIVILDLAGPPTPIAFRTLSFTLLADVTAVFNISANSVVGKDIAICIENLSTNTFNIGLAPIGFNNLTTNLYKGGDILATGFKSGASHTFGLVYFDQYMRQCGVQAITESYINFPTQRTYQEYFNTVVNPNDGYIPQLNWEIKHLPPSWAYYYAWVYDGGNIQNFAQIAAVISDTNTDITGTTIKINPENLYKYKFMYNSFSVGDKCRLLLKRGTLYNLVRYFSTIQEAETEYIETEIIGFSTTEIIVQTTNTKLNFSNVDSCLIELFSATKSELFFEQNEIYNIINPTASNRCHSGPNQNQDPNNPVSAPAKGDFLGNTYFRLIPNQISAITNPISILTPYFDYLTESNSITYNSESNFWNKGRAMIETIDQKETRYNTLYRWSNQLIQNTQVNGLSSFDSGNYGILSSKFGALTAMREVGYTLKMIQEVNYSTAFIGRKQLQNADGSTQLVVTDSLIGTVNPSEQLYGTKFPGSVVVNSRSVYWVDTVKGAVIRESGNGVFCISDYGMSRYWLDVCTQIRLGLFTEIIGGFDIQTESLFLTRKNDSSLIGEIAQVTISFIDPEKESQEKGWVSEHDFEKSDGTTIYPIDMYGSVGQSFTTCLRNGIYLHNKSDTFLNLYGEGKTFTVKSVMNPEPDSIKVFLAHWVKKNRSSLLTIFTIPNSAKNPVGMKSVLRTGNYVNREGGYYSDIKKDGYSKGLEIISSDEFIQQMISGRPMREQTIEIEISAIGPEIFVLFDHEVNYILSQWT